MAQTLTEQQILDENLSDWRYQAQSIGTRFKTGDFATGLVLVNRIGEVAEQMNHHPDVDLRFPHVEVNLTSHDVGGVTSRDVTAARRISEIAAELGVEAAPDQIAS